MYLEVQLLLQVGSLHPISKPETSDNFWMAPKGKGLRFRA